MAKKATPKKGQAKKRKSKKNNTNLVIVAVIGVACIGMVIVSGILNNKSKETDSSGMVTPGITNTPNEEVSPSVTPDITKEPEPTTTQAPTATPTEPEVVAEAKAQELVKAAIGDEQYTIKLSNENLSIDGKDYFEYRIYQQEKELSPAVIVLKEDGSLYYYDEAGVVSGFTKFPLDKVESAGDEEKTITENEAIEKASKLSRAALGLEKELKDYKIEVDNWTTVVNGKSCYCLNVFDESGGVQQLVGVYYVSVDGSNVYWLNEEEQEFVEIKE